MIYITYSSCRKFFTDQLSINLIHKKIGLSEFDVSVLRVQLKSLKEFWENKEFNVVFISATEKSGIQNLKKEL